MVIKKIDQTKIEQVTGNHKQFRVSQYIFPIAQVWYEYVTS